MEQTLGKRIMANRKRLGLTQDALAERLGVTAQAVSKWENDQSCPDITTLPKLSEIFGITTDELLGIVSQPIHQGEVIDAEDEDDSSSWEFHWDNSRKSSIGAAVAVLLVGALLLASNLLGWEASFWDILWPSALLVFGAFGLFPKFSFFRAGCLLFGGYFLINNLGFLPVSLGKEVIFPVLILLCGLSLLGDALKKPKKPMMHFHLNRKGKQKTECSTKDETFQCTQSFGENSHYISLSQLSGGEVSCSFGELTVDLSGCETVSEHCRIEVCCSFGETDILVPSHFLAETNISTFCGNYTICGTPSADPVGTILFTGGASFGEIKIRYI